MTESTPLFSEKSLAEIEKFVHDQLVESIRADPEFQRLMAEENARMFALFSATPTEVPK